MWGKKPLSDKKCHFTKYNRKESKEGKYANMYWTYPGPSRFCYSSHCRDQKTEGQFTGATQCVRGRAGFCSQVCVTTRPVDYFLIHTYFQEQSVMFQSALIFSTPAKPLEVLFPDRLSTQLAVKLYRGEISSLLAGKVVGGNDDPACRLTSRHRAVESALSERVPAVSRWAPKRLNHYRSGNDTYFISL